MKGRPRSKFESDFTDMIAKSNFCHTYTVNHFEEQAENSYVARLNIFWWLEIDQVRDSRDIDQLW